MTADSMVYCQTLTVACDGHNLVSSHPRIYLNLEKTGRVVCPYCSCEYHLKNQDQLKDQKNS